MNRLGQNSILKVERIAQSFLDTFFGDTLFDFPLEQQNVYKPFNVVKKDSDNYYLELLVPGFNKDELSVTVADNILTIEGKKNSENQDEKEYLRKNFHIEPFKQQFRLYEYMEVSNVCLENGILTVNIERRLPENKRPKIIEIS